MKRTIALVAMLMLLSASPAYAYLDPGAGSLLLQLLIGGIGGLIVTAKLFWRRFRASRDQSE